MKFFIKICLLLLLISVSACNFYSLKKDMLSGEEFNALKYPAKNANTTIYFNKHLTYTNDSKLLIEKHRVLKLGNNLKSAPELLYVYDNSLEKLLRCEARIVRRNKQIKYFGFKDFLSMRVSNARRISAAKVYYLPVNNLLLEGDIVEIISVHEQTFPQLGNIFSPAEAGNHAFNINYDIEYPADDSCYFLVSNGTVQPKHLKDETSKTLNFHWDYYGVQPGKNLFAFKNNYTTIISNFSIKPGIEKCPDWIDYGNWYLDLIKHRLHPTDKLNALTLQLTKNQDSPKAKMDAIFEYIQKNVRYEQVYLEYGGIIPNPPDLILTRMYGDCKDYSLMMYLMAKSAGLNVHLALCYRGRGKKFYKELPVSQFNHMILYFKDNNKNYWYDGTNRSGICGITSADLINQDALVLKQDSSKIIQISESEQNQIRISGRLIPNMSDLHGKIKIELNSQYAIDFFFLSYYLNKPDLYDYIVDWLHKFLGTNILIKNLTWDMDQTRFAIEFQAEIPNSIILIDDKEYLNLNKIFNRLIPGYEFKDSDLSGVNYYPGYGRIETSISLPDFIPDKSIDTDENFNIQLKLDFPPGPYDNNSKLFLKQEYKRALNEYTKMYKLKLKAES